MNAKNIFPLINDNSNKDYSNIKFQNIKKTLQDKLLLIAMKPILFYDGDKFSCKGIKQKKKKHDWLNLFLNFLIVTFTQEEEDSTTYGIVIEYFCEFYPRIKEDFVHFIKEFEIIKEKIDFDLFGVAICFLSYLNKNNKFLEILSELNKNEFIQDLKIDNDNLRKRNLYFVITDYCILYKIQNIQDNDYDITGLSHQRIIKEIKELKCYAELSPISNLYRNFLLTICACLYDSRDLRINQEKNVVDLIELIFIELNLHLRKKNYWEDNYLSIIINDIYDTALKYSTDNFDENYIDFVITYILKYDIPTENFYEYFLKGLDKKEFNKVFQNLNLKEDIGDLNKKETIIKLFDKVHRRKKNTSNSMDKNKGDKTFDSSKEKESDVIISFNQEQDKITQQKEVLKEDSEEKNNIKEKENEIKNFNIINKEDNTIHDKKARINDNDIHEEKKQISDDIIHEASTIETKEIIKQESEKEKDESKINNESKEIKDTNSKQIFFDLSDVEKYISDKMEILKKENEKRFIILEQENKKIKAENKQIKEENKQIKEDNKQIKEINKLIEEDNKRIKEDNKRIKEDNKRIKEDNKRIKEDNKKIISDKEIMEQKINSLEKANDQKDISIKQIRENCKNLTKELGRISFRDLSKKVLNNMIDFVNEKNGKLLSGLSKRKEKLDKINQYFNFKGIEYMQKPFREICFRYYNSNTKSHTPEIANDFHQKPFGLISDPEGSILKSYYETMIDSKDNKVLAFLSNELKLKKEIRNLYL